MPAALAPDMLAAGDQDHWTQTEPQLMTPAPQDEGEEEEGDQSQDDDVSSAAASLSSLLGAVSEHVAALTRGVAGGGHVDSSGVWDSESSQAGRSTTSSLRQYSTLLPPPPTFIKADIKLHSDAAIQQQQQTSSQQSGGAVAAARRTSYLC